MAFSLREKILRRVNRFIRLPVAGLDISDHTAKYLKFGENRSLSFESFGEIAIPEGIIAGGEIKDEDKLVAVFQSLLGEEGRHLRNSFFVVSLPEEKSFLRVLSVPKIKREEIGNVIRWEIEAQVPLPLEELVYDYEIIDEQHPGLDHFDVVLTAFPRTIVDSYVRVLERAGILPIALELESQAIIRAILPELRGETATIVVDMGRGRTSLILFAGGAILFTKTIELGGRTLEEHIMRTLQVDRERALEVKKEIGLDKRAHEGKIFSALLPALSVLADEIKRAVEYHRAHGEHTHTPGTAVGTILLVGGDANLFGLDTYLASAVRLPVRRGDSFAAIREQLAEPIPPIPKNEALAFTTAVGLAGRGLR